MRKQSDMDTSVQHKPNEKKKKINSKNMKKLDKNQDHHQTAAKTK